MTLARSKLTAQGQISVPAEIRRRLGIGPGAILEWDEEDGVIVVRRAGSSTSEDVHEAVFGDEVPNRHSLEDMERGIKQHVSEKHARTKRANKKHARR
ncbi:MAG: AbrB/MazE/SpoVT family DNA-binding domain-containing protein [Proteobacteria bacterium]|nr:AbrB/MazE/SpoVT family DNA-binding domain-containing protein [Pseudomonadota bacterium]